MDLNKCSCSGRSLMRLHRPAILAALAREPVHGYLLVRRLRGMAMFQGSPPDPTGVYRALRAMEGEGLVVSTWDLAESGPARRRFELTGEGKRCLARWLRTLRDYSQAIDELLGVLRRVR